MHGKQFRVITEYIPLVLLSEAICAVGLLGLLSLGDWAAGMTSYVVITGTSEEGASNVVPDMTRRAEIPEGQIGWN